MTKNLIYILILSVFISCSPKLLVTNKMNMDLPQKQDCNYIFGANEKLPDSSIIVANFETKGNFFTPMKYRVNQTLDLVINRTTDLNYNALKIDTVEFPGPFKSKSYDMKGKAMYLTNCPEKKIRLVNQVRDSDKRHIKLYRPNKILGSGISYPIFINEHFLCGLDNNSKLIIEISDTEIVKSLQIESYGERYTIPIDFKNDRIIYIQCKVGEVAKPKTMIENIEVGEKNFQKIKNMP